MQPTPPPATACGRRAPGRRAVAGQGAPAAAGTDIGTRRGPGVGAAAEAAGLSLQPAPGPYGRAPRVPRHPGRPARWVWVRAGDVPGGPGLRQGAGGGAGVADSGGWAGGCPDEHPVSAAAGRVPLSGRSGAPRRCGETLHGGGHSRTGGSEQGCCPRSRRRAGAGAASGGAWLRAAALLGHGGGGLPPLSGSASPAGWARR